MPLEVSQTEYTHALSHSAEKCNVLVFLLHGMYFHRFPWLCIFRGQAVASTEASIHSQRNSNRGDVSVGLSKIWLMDVEGM